jgi:hypothetical protein
MGIKLQAVRRNPGPSPLQPQFLLAKLLLMYLFQGWRLVRPDTRAALPFFVLEPARPARACISRTGGTSWRPTWAPPTTPPPSLLHVYIYYPSLVVARIHVLLLPASY